MIDLSTDKNRQIAIGNLQSLLTHPGWIMVEEIVNLNIEEVKKVILAGVKGETIEDVNRMRDKLAVHLEVINTPRLMIKNLEPEIKSEIPTDDPFATVEDNNKKV